MKQVILILIFALVGCSKESTYEKYIDNYFKNHSYVNKIDVNKITCQEATSKEIDFCVYHVLLQQKVANEVMDTYYCFSFVSSKGVDTNKNFLFQPSVDKCPSVIDADMVNNLIKQF